MPYKPPSNKVTLIFLHPMTCYWLASKGNIPVGYFNKIVMTHSMGDLYSDKEFEEVHQQLILIVKIRENKNPGRYIKKAQRG